MYYTEDTERSPMDGGDDYAQSYLLSAYCCIPIQPCLAFVEKLEVPSLVKVIIVIIHVNRTRRIIGSMFDCGFFHDPFVLS
jgi:hypothetical protein